MCAGVASNVLSLGLAKAADTSQVTIYALAIAFIGNAVMRLS
jgi:hypothetical protein